MFSVLAVLIRDSVIHTIHRRSDVENLGIPVLGEIPAMNSHSFNNPAYPKNRKRRNPYRQARRNCTSIDALRSGGQTRSARRADQRA